MTADPKMVPESDLIALKESNKTALEELKTGHASEITELGNTHTSTIEGLNTQIRTGSEDGSRLRATITELEEKVSNGSATGDELTKVKGELKTASASLKEAQETLAGDIRTRLIGDFQINEKALEGKTVSELTVIKDALAASGKPKSGSYVGSGGSGGGGDDKKTTGADKVREGLEAGDLRAT